MEIRSQARHFSIAFDQSQSKSRDLCRSSTAEEKLISTTYIKMEYRTLQYIKLVCQWQTGNSYVLYLRLILTVVSNHSKKRIITTKLNRSKTIYERLNWITSDLSIQWIKTVFHYYLSVEVYPTLFKVQGLECLKEKQALQREVVVKHSLGNSEPN